MIALRRGSQAVRLRFAKGTEAEDASGHEVTAEDTLVDDEVSAAERVAPSGTARPGESIGLAQEAFVAGAAKWRSKAEDAVWLIDDGDVAGARDVLKALLDAHDGPERASGRAETLAAIAATLAAPGLPAAWSVGVAQIPSQTARPTDLPGPLTCCERAAHHRPVVADGG